MSEFTPDGQLVAVWPIRAGATFIKKYRWGTGDPVVYVDFTGWTARCEIRTTMKSSTVLLSLTDTDGITLDSLGNITIELSAAQTMSLYSLKKAVTDVELESPTGYVRNLVGASIVIYSNATRETTP
jgi:hypothetical protein